MFSKTRSAALVGTLLLVAGQAGATIMLNTGITGTFSPGATYTGTNGNDIPGHPNRLYFGQLSATANGWVDFYYLGNEAAYTNVFTLGGNSPSTSQSISTAGRPDTFNAHQLIGSLAVNAGSLLDFDFCTSGGDSVNGFGRCVQNDNAASITAQYNYNQVGGYRSIAYAGLSSFNPNTGARSYSSPLNPSISNLWGLFWDDSGARNDDNHDDMFVVASFRPRTVRVPEPGTIGLVAMGLAALVITQRRQLAAKVR
jgi:hypothetical protein